MNPYYMSEVDLSAYQDQTNDILEMIDELEHYLDAISHYGKVESKHIRKIRSTVIGIGDKVRSLVDKTVMFYENKEQQ